MAILVMAVAGLTVGTVVLARSRDEVKAARDELETNFEQMREVVDHMLSRVADELKDQPHMEQLRKELLEKALAIYVDIQSRLEDRPQARYETAGAHRRVGDIYEMVGRHDGARSSFSMG
jgi:hypothetical protein